MMIQLIYDAIQQEALDEIKKIPDLHSDFEDLVKEIKIDSIDDDRRILNISLPRFGEWWFDAMNQGGDTADFVSIVYLVFFQKLGWLDGSKGGIIRARFNDCDVTIGDILCERPDWNFPALQDKETV